MADEQYYRQMQEATALLQENEIKGALLLLEHLYELHPENVDVVTNLSAAYILLKQYKKAVPILEAATEIAADNPAVWSNLAAAYLGTLYISTRENQEKAIRAYERVLEINPAHPNTYYNLGLIYEDRGDWANARDMFVHALQVNPADKDARNLLAKAERMLSENRSA